MVSKPKAGYIYRFHKHQPGANEPKPRASPHISPGTSSPARMPDQLEPSAHYYPPTWDAHPMLPPGTIDATPRGSAAPSPLSRVDAQPTPQLPMSIHGSPGIGGDPLAGEGESFKDWVCCAKRRAEGAVVQVGHGIA